MQENALFRKRYVPASLVGLLCWVGACGGESVDLGNNTAELQASTLAGTWVGSVAGDRFVTSPKTLRLTIDDSGQGTLLVGDAPVVVVDPSIGSPPEAQADAAEATGMLLHLYEGATYTTRNVQVDGNSYDFAVDMVEAFEPWCSVQTPMFTTNGHRCRENWGGEVRRENGKQCFVINPETGIKEEEDCLALWLCSIDQTLGCFCTQTECRAESRRGVTPLVPFELELNDASDELRGTLAAEYEERDRLPVVLVREPAQ